MQRRVVEQGGETALEMVVMDGHQKRLSLSTTVADHSVKVYSRGGSELISSTSSHMTVVDDVLLYAPTWNAASFPVGDGYKATFTIKDSLGQLHTRIAYFSVELRLFRSTLLDSTLEAYEPRLSGQNPNADFQVLRELAWVQITNRCWSRFKLYPGRLFYPESFEAAHAYLALAMFFRSNLNESRQGDDYVKMEAYQDLYHKEMRQALERPDFDLDGDGRLEDGERGYVSTVEIVR